MTTVPYRIVVGVDGTPAGVRALRWAFRQAAARCGVVEAVIVTGRDRTVVTDSGQVHRNEGERILSEAIVVALGDNPRITVRSRVVPGSPAAGLVSAAAGAQLLVLGDHATGRLRRAALGSVAEACIRAGGCPVVVVPDAAVSAVG
jgi:nucleotide-binding universal stress UspA family protein